MGISSRPLLKDRNGSPQQGMSHFETRELFYHH
jgi:hypothetical protein